MLLSVGAKIPWSVEIAEGRKFTASPHTYLVHMVLDQRRRQSFRRVVDCPWPPQITHCTRVVGMNELYNDDKNLRRGKLSS